VAIHRPPDQASDDGASSAEAGAEAASIDALVAAGRHAEAAAAALAAGDAARATAIYERIWDWAGACRAARVAGDPGRALRAAIEARDDAQVSELVRELSATDAGARAALDALARGRRHAEAAVLAERLGDGDRAIDLYQRAHRDLDAARLLEAAGRDRDAGRLLEKVIDLASGDESAEAHLRLGRILARRAAHEAAARHLQEAAKHPAARAEAWRHLVPALAAMGLRDAARDVLLDLRRLDPDLTVDLDAYLRAWRDSGPRPTAADRELIAGRYRIGKLLGAGGAGRVFLAQDEIAARAVALKMFHAGRGSTAYERFVREARLAASLRHPALVEVYDVSLEHGYLVMEYLAGGSLALRLGAGEPLSGAQVRRLAIELLGGLEAAHHRGVVHRDVKPANVFFDGTGSARLGDFGVAHLIDLGQTQTGGLIGTLAYMSPEQITGANITIAADLYALGVTLFEALTGRLPFLGPDFVAQHLGEAPPLVTQVGADVAAGWETLVARLLRKSPADRWESLDELRRALSAIDLGERAGPALVLPRPRRDSRPHSIAALAADELDAGEKAPRYQFETALGTTPISELARAVDTVLDRSVVIERFADSEAGASAMARIRRLAKASTPFVQRALALDRTARVAVFETPAGSPVVGPRGLSPSEVIRLWKRLARAAAALHEVGAAHGAITAPSVVIDDAGIPTIMAAGLGAELAEPRPVADVDAILDVVAAAAGVPTGAGVLDALIAHLIPEAAKRPALPAPAHGAALYAAADAIEIAMLEA
jgi:tRNA A-37 threonylcarbamoyl transferase component Bud32